MVSHRFGGGDARFVGEIIGQLHLALSKIEDCVNDADLLAAVRDWALPKAKAALELPDKFCTEYLNTFSELYPTLPRQIIHRDPNPGNILRAEDQWGFIDFELSERNARIYDPCYAATSVLSELPQDLWPRWPAICREILMGYDQVMHLTDPELAAIPWIILANQLICVAWFAGQDKYAELLKTNVAMTRFIAENLDTIGLQR